MRPNPPIHRPGTGRPPHFRPIRRPAFVWPRGWSYRRWWIGATLPHTFMSSNFFFDDWTLLGVGRAPAGHVWVRWGPDLLLVRRRDRRIVDVIHGAFF